MNPLYIIFDLILIGLGCIMIFDQDRAWGWYEKSQLGKGIRVERTSEWERNYTGRGLTLIVMGIIFLVFTLMG